MRKVVFDVEAQIDIIAILNTSHVNFGPDTAKRYGELINAGVTELAATPNRSGSHLFEGRVWLFPLRLLAASAGVGRRVRRPRHLIAYTFDDETIRIVRILHDRMDVTRSIPDAPD